MDVTYRVGVGSETLFFTEILQHDSLAGSGRREGARSLSSLLLVMMAKAVAYALAALSESLPP